MGNEREEQIKKVVKNAFCSTEYIFYRVRGQVAKFLDFAQRRYDEAAANPCDILVVCNDEQKSETFCIKLLEAARDTGIFHKGFVMYHLDQLYNTELSVSDIQEKYSILIVYGGNESSVREKHLKKLTEQLCKNDMGDLSFIFCVNEAGAAVLDDGQLYGSFFENKNILSVNLNKTDEDEIYEQLTEMLDKDGYTYTQEFLNGTRSYISMAYPGTPSKDSLFAGLYSQVVRNALFHGSKNMDVECAPVYHERPALVRKPEAPSSREFGSNRREKENVLFLTMSTMNSPTMYKYKGANEEAARFIGISQLEPGTKNVLYQLAQKGEKLDRIVIVESHDTRVREVADIADGFWKESGYEDYAKSAVCFYKQRIRDYIGGKKNKKVLIKSRKVIPGYAGWETDFRQQCEDMFHIRYSDEELRTLFYDIPTYAKENEKREGAYREESLELFMEIIRGIKGEAEEEETREIQLYVDTQGGARSAIQQINAVLELLKDQNVTIMGRYAIPNFNYRDQNAVNEIREVGEAYKSYELVSSMTEFRQYGRGKGLAEFFHKNDDELTGKVTAVIQKISGAIAICNISEFETALQEMRELDEETDHGEKLNSQLRLVFQDIVSDYRELLSENRTAFDAVKWCVKRYYYQQAITLIESRMPKMLVECGLLEYDKVEKPKEISEVIYVYNKGKKIKKMKILEKIEEAEYKGKKCCLYTLEDLCINNKSKDNLNVTWKPDENYLFEQWIYSNQYSEKKDGNTKVKYFGVDMDLSDDLSGKFMEIKEQFGKHKCRRLQVILLKSNYALSYEGFDRNIRGNDSNQKLFRMFSALSAMLKEARNEINHANSEISEAQIRNALEAYIEIGEMLKLNEV